MLGGVRESTLGLFHWNHALLVSSPDVSWSYHCQWRCRELILALAKSAALMFLEREYREKRNAVSDAKSRLQDVISSLRELAEQAETCESGRLSRSEQHSFPKREFWTQIKTSSTKSLRLKTKCTKLFFLQATKNMKNEWLFSTLR